MPTVFEHGVYACSSQTASAGFDEFEWSRQAKKTGRAPLRERGRRACGSARHVRCTMRAKLVERTRVSGAPMQITVQGYGEFSL